MMLKVGIAGCGAIGSSLAKTIADDFRGKAAVVGLFDVDRAKSSLLAKKLRRPALARKDIAGLVESSQLIIEASSAAASASIAEAALRRGRSVMVMSVGGLLDGRIRLLERLCRRKGGRLYIPSGAVSGIDALKAARVAGIRRVTLTTTKAPRSFEGVAYVRARGIRLDRIKRPTVLFSGSAADAVKYFPQNINVAAVLSLAGIGARRTKVKIIASPLATKNIHEIIIESVSARIVTRTENTVHPRNPKTSYLAVLSAVALLAQIVGPVRIGT
jgi:aspartate dehydrogenase